ncbi:hypothetical protein [Streptomyces sp. AGS-58]|uniref:hypothetical protein n=1 Tax=unclassified Streptomyces TaxID=2593676 RepID=UPI0035A32EC3
MNTRYRNARALATAAFCLGFAGFAVAAWSAITVGFGRGDYLPPFAYLLCGAAALAWASRRERAAGHRADTNGDT